MTNEEKRFATIGAADNQQFDCSADRASAAGRLSAEAVRLLVGARRDELHAALTDMMAALRRGLNG